MISHIKKVWPDISFAETPKDLAADCDGVLIHNDTLVGLYESKCRNLTYNELQKFGSWLVTHDKLERCKELSKALHVPFLGFLYLIPDQRVLYWKITNEDGKYQFNIEVKPTVTQATINGGQIERMNAYLPIKYSKEI